MTKPNIVFILTDDLGWRDLTCCGSDFYETPNLDRLATQGMRFCPWLKARVGCTRAAPVSRCSFAGPASLRPDPREDSGEQNNLASSLPDLAAELVALLHDWHHKVEAKIPQSNPDWVPRA